MQSELEIGLLLPCKCHRLRGY
ncbi:MAG: hypothetical protein ABI837_18055 [Acidobacteriota bacterium]